MIQRQNTSTIIGKFKIPLKYIKIIFQFFSRKINDLSLESDFFFDYSFYDFNFGYPLAFNRLARASQIYVPC